MYFWANNAPLKSQNHLTNSQHWNKNCSFELFIRFVQETPQTIKLFLFPLVVPYRWEVSPDYRRCHILWKHDAEAPDLELT